MILVVHDRHADTPEPGRHIVSELLTLAEIQTRFDSEWILVEDPLLGDSFSVRSGRVIWHSRDRDEVYQKLLELRPRHPAILYTGKMPEGTAIAV